ncbi:penicillin-binding protein 1A [Bradyrhizobium sp. U87765 SZCCT0131]|uniref:transglycosylase domain-containing protein n=1 Tax=unclassified Bradyrhizobium TaxID=2631580 RepID=UPI001BAB8981|nr:MULTISPECIES: PBP1A family penicillin-binding protein [unclassified Bradyrhizobium]MBR1217056.1 penicillin-binding protein 1A [Bradyrhizobium sp. U87765 SZCCT0131]MBR1259188.1 penicillin-binding protein 1A [Bradyrhizobium sp. U87765 SZCCT0134]MBR1305329.1 penicillin-binding protein 1A [Bradyrhizobium sp. U87765 SZCCT0110]MBR1321115.1 penicillin-binding protein 1A [Bradyrhizobium sp. U87765 SZCCT0109]MBR1350231.1 penicillin-binding protein 1A [Bradyrhizobium sp. U87765 SZCCT0048]
MGSSRRNGEGRREPRFGPSSSLVDLRLGEDDRVRVADPKPAPKRRKAAPAPPDDEPDEAPPPRRAARSKTRGKAKRERGSFGIGRLIYWGAVLGLWGVIAVVGLVIYIGAHLPPIQSLEIPKRPPTIQIVGSEGTLLATRGEMAGANVALKDLPPYLPKAFIAIEDRRFYSHFGIDPMGIVRAAVANVLHRGVSQGGSTLTQQLAKNLFLTQERTMQRKLQEAELAIWLERKHSKNEILELYLNRVYFGSGAYGVEAAAQRYFGKSARNVTIAEAAMLAGLVKSPSRLAPNRNPEGAERRAQTVLTAMADAGFITDAQAKANLGHPSYAVKPAGAGTVNYVADWVADVLDDLIGQIDQNITVDTTIDPKLQSVAEAAIIDELAAKSVKFNVSQGALVAMTPNGEVRAMVGGRNYADSQFNRAVTARRQPGSAFKPFVYLTAMEQGLTPDTIRQDGPLDIKGWKPENYTHEYFGSVTLTQALAMSLNTVAVRVGLEVGPKNVVRTAHRLGIASKLDANPSIALGTSEVSVLELVGAYAPFANGGHGVSPHVISRIRTTEGNKVLYARPADPPNQVIEPRYVAMMDSMMQETLLTGTARKAELPGWQAAGKTGTSQDFRDAWFIGFTANLVTGVWLGNDDNSPTRKATGGGLPVEVWTRFMRTAHQNVPVATLPNSERSLFSGLGSLFGGSAQTPAQPQQMQPQPLQPQPMQPPPAAPQAYPGYPPPQANAAARPPVTQTSGRPEAAAGLDGGWLVDRLFGGRR